MADSIEVLRKLSDACLSRRLTADECGEFYEAIRALSPAGGDLHHLVWSIVRPYIQPAAREKVNAALKEILAATPQQEPGAKVIEVNHGNGWVESK